MFKDILLVGIGSFVGGSLRMVVSLGNAGCECRGLFPDRCLFVTVRG